MARSGICPVVPQRNRKTYDDTPPTRDTKDLPVPDAAFSSCQGSTNVDEVVAPRPGGTTTTITKCCPSPGPAGPEGPPGEGVPVGGTAGQVLSKIDGTDYNTEWRDVHEVPAGGTTGQVLGKASGTDYDVQWQNSGIGNVTWRGYWQSGVTYYDNDIVSYQSSSFICNIEHTSSPDNAPDKNFDDNPGGFEWSLLSAGPNEEEKSLLENLFDGYLDWLGPISEWGLAEWGSVLAIGTGIYLAGQTVVDMFNDDGQGDGNADSTYNGDPTYNGAYTPPTLDQLLSAICDYSGITNYDVSQIAALAIDINGLSIGSITPSRQILDVLSKVYFFDMVDTSGTLKFIPRSQQTSVRTLTINDDLGYGNNGATSPIVIKRYQGADLPKIIALEYINADAAYNKATQEARLETFDEGVESRTSIPLVLSDQEAYEIAEKLLVNSHIERTTYGFTTTYKHIDLEPGDVITVETIGDVRILRVDENKDNGLLNFLCTDASFNDQTYQPSGQPAQTVPPYQDKAINIGYSGGIALELPPLDATDVNQRFSLAVHGFGAEGWPGAKVYMSTDNLNYSEIGSVSKEATWGKVATAINTPTNWQLWDDTTTITVELKTGTLRSMTDVDVQNGFNWCVIGEEVIGFVNATLVGPNTYELSRLLRGRRGTEFTVHQDNELFVLLDDSIIEYEYPLDGKDYTYYFKYVTRGSDLSKATAYQVQGNMRSRRPWPVAHLNATQDPVTNDWTITWVGRNQFDGEMVDSTTTFNPDGFTGYAIAILESLNSPEVIKRTTVTQNTTFVYKEADQIADFGSVQTTLNIRINQLDSVAGPGTPVKKTF